MEGFCYLSAGSIFRFECRMYCEVVKRHHQKSQIIHLSTVTYPGNNATPWLYIKPCSVCLTVLLLHPLISWSCESISVCGGYALLHLSQKAKVSAGIDATAESSTFQLQSWKARQYLQQLSSSLLLLFSPCQHDLSCSSHVPHEKCKLYLSCTYINYSIYKCGIVYMINLV